MEFESNKKCTTAKLPILKMGKYEMWVIRIKQYFQIQDYALWEMIENGNSWVSVPQTTQENGTSVTKMSIPVTAKEKTNKKNDVKARGLLLMTLPNEHQLTFSQYPNAKSMFAAIETRFGGNAATKKTQKTLLKQQYENFSASSAKSLDSIFNRLQKIVSRLVILCVIIAQEDLNLKNLSSLPPEWNTHVVVWMNKPEVKSMSIDDLYNNFKIVEQKVKKTVGTSIGAQNLAFMTAPSTSSTNDANTASPQVSAASPSVNAASPQVCTTSVSDNTVYAFMVENPNGSNVLHQDLEQIHEDDLEAMDLKWQLSLLSMRAKKAPRSKEGQFSNQDNTRKQGNNEDKSTKAMLAIDGVGFDWSDMAEEQVQINMALMAFSDSEISRNLIEVYVSFGRSEQYGVEITGKGTLKTDNLDFEDKEHVLDFDMKNIVPKESLTCLVAKATLDESMLWHRRLGHINFKNINKLVKDNLVRGLPTKRFENDQTYVACLKGKQHRASCKSKVLNPITKPLFMLHMDLFGPTFVSSLMHKKEKGIKREYSVARTPQQNGVVERRNRILIEAARTIGFKPALCFMRPFGCHVTILNTSDILGKFDGKSDEGFFVGYSLSSKALRVYNTRTRRVEENLHIGFLENKPMIEGNDPKWLFDIDSLTQSMNYVPVTAGIISNASAGTSEEINQDCIVMPIWKDTSYFDSPTKDVENGEPKTANDAQKHVEDSPNNENAEQDKFEVDSSTKDVNVAGQHANTASPGVNTGSLKLNAIGPSVNTASSNKQDSPKDMFTMEVSHTLEATHIEFFSDEDEPEIDNVIGDVKSSVQTRRMTKPTFEQGFLSDVYKQITYDTLNTCLYACFLSQIEPTSIAKALSDSSWVEPMQEELMQFKLQQVWILVDLPSGKKAIGTKWDFRNKKYERGIVIRNKARLVAQGHRQEEGIDYEENLPQNRKQAEIHSNVLKPGMYRISTTTTQSRTPQLPHASRNTNPYVSKSIGVNHYTSVSRPQLKCYQVKDKVVPNNSQVKFNHKEVEEHHRISSISRKTKSVTAYLNDVNARTKKPKVVPISASKPKRKANKSVATPHKKTVASDTTIQKSKSYYKENDQFAPILGYGDLNQGNVTIKWVYYVEGLNHNLFSVGQFCDADLEVAFRKSTCFVRDLQGNDLLTGNRGSDLYTISLQEITSSTPICFMAKASPTQAWLWHRRLSHLNFDYITLLSKKDIVTGLPKLTYVKDQLCLSCEMSKAKRSSFKSKAVPSSKGRLNLLHMDLCGPMRVASINGKKYILVIVDDYSRYTWTLFLRSKDETPETLHAYFKEEGIEHQTSTPRTPEQNGVVERQNRTLVEAARTMLSASKLPLSFWAEAVATACYTQNRSIIISTHGKTAYHIINDRKPSIKHLHIFGCICYITRDGENLDKMKEKGDPCVMVGYSTQSKGYRVYNKRTRLIVESIHIKFDEIKEMMSDHNSSDLAPQRQEMSVENVSSGLVPQGQKASDYDNSDPVPPRQNVVPTAEKTDSSQQGLEFLFSPLLEEYYNPTHGLAEDNNNDQAPNASFQEDEFVSLNLLSRTRKLGHSTMELRSLIS
ncbi:retrovirus-related pol polyprotein from transposon TNT 1-94 [Tanacetum coccineum]